MSALTIPAALLQLDPANDEHWTSEGLPLVDWVSYHVARRVTRQEVTNADPTFNRDSARELLEQRTKAAYAPGTEPAKPPTAPTASSPDSLGAEDQADGREDGTGGQEFEGQPEELTPETLSVLKMPPAMVLGSRTLTERALRELEVLNSDANARKKKAEADMEAYAVQIEVMSRHLDRMSRNAPDPHTANIRAYLATTQAAREKRVLDARRFIQGGTTQKAVLEQLQTKSPIDRAMERKTGRGTNRPNIPMHQTTAQAG